MSTKSLPAVAAIGVVIFAAEASAALPPGTFYNSGMTGDYPIGVLETSTNVVHVLFANGGDTADWQPVPNVVGFLGQASKPQDGHRDYAVVASAPDEVWSYPAGGWISVPGAGLGGTAVWNDQIAWPIWAATEGAVRLRTLPGPGTVTLLAGNGRTEDNLSLHQNRIAYQYWGGTSTNVAVFEIGTGEIFHAFGGTDPDIYGDRIAYNAGGYIAVDSVAGSPLPSFDIWAPAGCAKLGFPHFAGAGQWIAYVAYCTSGMQVWVRDVAAGTDHYLGDIGSANYLHAGPNWIVWADSSFVVRAFVWGGGGSGTVPGTFTGSGYKGNDPAVAIDSSGKWHTVFTDHSATIDWVVSAGATAVGKPMRAYAGYARMVAAEFLGEIVGYDLDNQSWTSLGKGQYPAAYHHIAIWNDPYSWPDLSLSWSYGLPPSGGGILFGPDPYDDSLPSIWEKTIAFEHHNGIDQDVVIGDLSGAVLHTITGTSHQRQPDIWADSLVYVDDTHGLRYRKAFWNPLTDVAVPLPSGCAGARLPRLGFKANWVLFEAYGCNGGTTSELYLIDMTGSQILYFVGRVAPPRGFTPQYAIADDQVVFVDGATHEVIHVDVDETMI